MSHDANTSIAPRADSFSAPKKITTVTFGPNVCYTEDQASPTEQQVLRYCLPDGRSLACRVAGTVGCRIGEKWHPGDYSRPKRFVPASITPASGKLYNNRLLRRASLHLNDWLMLEQKRLSHLGVGEEHLGSECYTLLQRKEENRKDRNVDQLRSFNTLSLTLHNQVKAFKSSRLPPKLPPLAATAPAEVTHAAIPAGQQQPLTARPVIANSKQGLVNLLSPFYTFHLKSTCGCFFNYDTDHRKYLTGIGPADLVKWYSKLDTN